VFYSEPKKIKFSVKKNKIKALFSKLFYTSKKKLFEKKVKMDFFVYI